jgi:hypothetical protein
LFKGFYLLAAAKCIIEEAAIIVKLMVELTGRKMKRK